MQPASYFVASVEMISTVRLLQGTRGFSKIRPFNEVDTVSEAGVQKQGARSLPDRSIQKSDTSVFDRNRQGKRGKLAWLSSCSIQEHGVYTLFF